MLDHSKSLRLAAAALLIFVLLSESAAPARGQNVGSLRAAQGRRVGRIRLPTPPFNPDAGVLGRRRGRVHNPPKTTSRRSPRRGVKATNRKPRPGTPRRRRVRRSRNVFSAK